VFERDFAFAMLGNAFQFIAKEHQLGLSTIDIRILSEKKRPIAFEDRFVGHFETRGKRKQIRNYFQKTSRNGTLTQVLLRQLLTAISLTTLVFENKKIPRIKTKSERFHLDRVL
jgi:hypothetical protein